MFADNIANGGAGFVDSGAQISNRNNKKGKANFKRVFKIDLVSWGGQNFSL